MKQIWERFQLLEVYKKKVSAWTKSLKIYLVQKKDIINSLLINCIEIVVYGIFINLIISILHNGIEFSIIGILGFGGAYFVLVDFINVLRENNFVLFYDWKKGDKR